MDPGSHLPAGPAALPPIRVYVVEDLDPIRQALRLLLDGSPGYACAGTAASAEEALDATLEAEPEVILLDVGLPGMSGIEALGPLRSKWPRAEFVVLTVFDDAERVFEALCAGATGYLVKETPPAAVLAAIREVHEGGAPMSASIARRVVGAFRKPGDALGELTAREREVLDGLVAGRTYGQIADGLFVSRNTVGFHVKQVYAKLHVRSRAEAVARVVGPWRVG